MFVQFINRNGAAKPTVFNTFFTISPPRRRALRSNFVRGHYSVKKNLWNRCQAVGDIIHAVPVPIVFKSHRPNKIVDLIFCSKTKTAHVGLDKDNSEEAVAVAGKANDLHGRFRESQEEECERSICCAQTTFFYKNALCMQHFYYLCTV